MVRTCLMASQMDRQPLRNLCRKGNIMSLSTISEFGSGLPFPSHCMYAGQPPQSQRAYSFRSIFISVSSIACICSSPAYTISTCNERTTYMREFWSVVGVTGGDGEVEAHRTQVRNEIGNCVGQGGQHAGASLDELRHPFAARAFHDAFVLERKDGRFEPFVPFAVVCTTNPY